jgi:hypothetical protein
MITNKGKSIIAKYLIGDAPAYASYIALGCGPKPRPNINIKTEVSLTTLTGSFQLDDSRIVGISSTLGLVPGMTLTRVSGVNLGNSPTATATIVSVDSLTEITTTTATTPTLGGVVTFSTSGVASLLSVSNTEGLWIGAGVSNEQFPSGEDVLVTAVNRTLNRFTITPGPILKDDNTPIAFPISLNITTNPKKESLDFEMFRVPISSRGYVNDDGVNKIVLTAQLPTEERYEITEVGIYSAGTNSVAGRYDSKVITAFSANENWELVVKQEPVGSAEPVIAIQTIPQYQDSILSGNAITKTDSAIKINTSNGLFLGANRLERYERPRFLSNVIMLKSDSSQIFKSLPNEASELTLQGPTSYIEINGKTLDLSQNSTSDLLKVAFSIISINGTSPDAPDFVNIIVEFSNSDGSQTAKLEINADNNILDFTENRYVVSQKRLDEIVYSGPSFSWGNISKVKAYASAIDKLAVTLKKFDFDTGRGTITTGGIPHGAEVGQYILVSIGDERFDGYKKITAKEPTKISFAMSNFESVAEAPVTNGFVDVVNKNLYISLDAIRLDNITTTNPLYGLSGYSVIQNSSETTVVKSPNTSNYLEYRFSLDVT